MYEQGGFRGAIKVEIEGFFLEVGEAMAGGQPNPAEIDRLNAKYDVFFTEGLVHRPR